MTVRELIDELESKQQNPDAVVEFHATENVGFASGELGCDLFFDEAKIVASHPNKIKIILS